FLTSLTDAFHKRLASDPTVKPQYHYFVASMEAISIRFLALDRLAAEFPKACVNDNVDLGKRREQNQILFDFFSNAWAAVESFCCGSYFIGCVLAPQNFKLGMPENGKLKKLWKIDSKETLNAYRSFEPHSSFTKQLQGFLGSKEFKLISSMRNLLVHRMVPGRTIRVSTVPGVDLPHEIDLDTWYDGDAFRL